MGTSSHALWVSMRSLSSTLSKPCAISRASLMGTRVSYSEFGGLSGGGRICGGGVVTKATISEMTWGSGKGGVRKVEVFDNEEELTSSLANYTCNLCDRLAKEKGSFTVVLSGGSLIKSLSKLIEPPYVDAIEWSKWHVLWADERVVPKDHDDSNYKLAFHGFLSRVPILPGNVYSINDALSAEAAAQDYETCVKHLVTTGVIDTSSITGFPKFDLVLLGMGPDGHVASLFPGHPLLKEEKKWVTYIENSPKPPPQRITLTFPVINSAANVAVVCCGAGKADAVQCALGKSQNSDVLPVQMVAPEGELKWFLDKHAASKL